MLRFSGTGVSDVGHVREHNEDSGLVGPYVSLVADGVGGAAAGEVASATAAHAVAAAVLARTCEAPEQVVAAGVDLARAGIRRAIQRDLTRLGMATTLTVLVCDGERVVLGHVGDSRAYRLREGELAQLSVDHTYVAHLVESGQLDRRAVSRHPWRNVVLRSLDGDPAGREVDVVPVEARVGDRFLLCSDGLTDLVPDERICELLATGEPRSVAAALTEEALAAGGRDNVTCVVLDLVDGPLVVGDGAVLGALLDPANVVEPGAVRLV